MATTVADNPFDTQPPKTNNSGIVNSAMQTAAPTTGQMPSNVGTTAPATPDVATYAPTTRQINQPTDTVQGQVDSILAKDSPLMQRARTLATQQMAQRGLVNSSMAVGAGTAAMIDRATPIAQSDANFYNQAASENMGALNQSGQFNAGEINRFGLQTGQQRFTAQQAELDRAQQTSLQGNQQRFTAEQSSLDRTQQATLQSAQFNFTAAQSALERAQQAYLQDRGAENQMKLQKAQQDFGATQAALDRAQQSSLQNDAQVFQQQMLNTQQAFTAAQSSLDRQQQAYLQDDAQEFQRLMQNTTIPANFALQISSSTMQSINAIAADANLSGTVDGKEPAGSSPKSRAIQSTLNYANSQINWANTFYKTSIPNMPESAVTSDPAAAPPSSRFRFGDTSETNALSLVDVSGTV